jgi:hypothetical protein
MKAAHMERDMRNKTIHFTVAGTGRFPIDMLRYDGCYPLEGKDAAKIENSFDLQARREMGRYEVELVTHSPNGPTIERWNSFMWGVVDCDAWTSERRLLAAVGASRKAKPVRFSQGGKDGR